MDRKDQQGTELSHIKQQNIPNTASKSSIKFDLFQHSYFLVHLAQISIPFYKVTPTPGTSQKCAQSHPKNSLRFSLN